MKKNKGARGASGSSGVGGHRDRILSGSGQAHWRGQTCKNLAAGLLALAAWAGSSAAHAVDWQVFAASGDRAGVKRAGVGLVWDPHAPLWQGQAWQIRLLHEAQIAHWDVPRASNILELGYSPMFRLQRGTAGVGRWSPFVEIGIGVRLLSHTRLSPETSLSTAFQFSDTIGVGVQFGRQGHSTLGLRYQHLSNAGIRKPNPGINFTQVYFQQRF